MTTHTLERRPTQTDCVARARSTPAGDIDLDPGDADAAAYGPVEIAWYPDRLRITALNVGPASITEMHLDGEASQDVVFEIRLPSLDELIDTVPGAD